MRFVVKLIFFNGISLSLSGTTGLISNISQLTFEAIVPAKDISQVRIKKFAFKPKTILAILLSDLHARFTQR